MENTLHFSLIVFCTFIYSFYFLNVFFNHLLKALVILIK